MNNENLEELRMNILNIPLKQGQMLTSELAGAYIFRSGSWWQIHEVDGGTLLLREVTNAEMASILSHPAMFILHEIGENH